MPWRRQQQGREWRELMYKDQYSPSDLRQSIKVYSFDSPDNTGNRKNFSTYRAFLSRFNKITNFVLSKYPSLDIDDAREIAQITMIKSHQYGQKIRSNRNALEYRIAFNKSYDEYNRLVRFSALDPNFNQAVIPFEDFVEIQEKEEFMEVIRDIIDDYIGTNEVLRIILSRAIDDGEKLPAIAHELNLKYNKVKKAYYKAIEAIRSAIKKKYRNEIANGTAPELVERLLGKNK